MAAVLYYIVLPFIYLLSVLPFAILYAISGILYVLLYHVVGYRKQVVLQNLRNSFPEKSPAEIRKLGREFYRYLCDLFLETFKTLTISKETMLKHCYLTPESKALLDRLAAENKSVILVLGHYGNWEWGGNTFSLSCKHQLYVIYHPLGNKYFNGLVYRMRTRFGTKLIAMKDTYREMLGNKTELSATAFIADQTPLPQNAFWTIFLHQETPVFKGVEIISRKIGYPIVYVRVNKIKRGYYEMTAEMLLENPAATKDGEISELHTKRLEQDIIKRPDIWLWSHKRWKHKRIMNDSGND